MFYSYLRPAQTRKHCCRSKNAFRMQKNVFGKFQKHFLLSRCRFCVFNICCIGDQTRNHLGNTEETLTFNVSRMFPHLRTQATYLEDAKCLVSLPFTHPYNIESNIDSKCYCSNVFLFALALRSWSPVKSLSLKKLSLTLAMLGAWAEELGGWPPLFPANAM